MSRLAEDIDMASKGWELWDGMISRHPDAGGTCYFVFFHHDRITLRALELFAVFRKKKRFKEAVMITDNAAIRELIQFDATINIEIFSAHDIDCLLKYYSLHKFSDNFYVLSLDKFEQCCLEPVMDELSLDEIILLGLYRLDSVG